MSIRTRLNILLGSFLITALLVGAVSLIAVDRYAKALYSTTTFYERSRRVEDLLARIYLQQQIETDLRTEQYPAESENMGRSIFSRLKDLLGTATNEDERLAIERVEVRYREWYELTAPKALIRLVEKQRALIEQINASVQETSPDAFQANRTVNAFRTNWGAFEHRFRELLHEETEKGDASETSAPTELVPNIDPALSGPLLEAQAMVNECVSAFRGLSDRLTPADIELCNRTLTSIVNAAEVLEANTEGGAGRTERATVAGPLEQRDDVFGRLVTAIESLRRQNLNEAEAIVSEQGMTGFYAFVAVTVGFGVILLGGLITNVMIQRSVVRRVMMMSQAAGRIGSGDLDYRIGMAGRDELASLAEQFDVMAAKLKQHQARLLEATELAMLGAISSSVAHGMRNPLAGIRASAQLLASQRKDDPQLVESLHDIVEEVDRLNNRISRLVDLARQGRLDLSPMRAAELLPAVELESRSLLSSREISLDIIDNTNGAEVRVDPDKVAQTLAELITNAAHHSPPGARVRLESGCDEQSGEAVFRVIDEGAGIEPRVREQVFDLFYSTRPQGTGMGLACAKRIIEMHGGTIDLESTPGEGTRVEVRIPLAGNASDDGLLS